MPVRLTHPARLGAAALVAGLAVGVPLAAPRTADVAVPASDAASEPAARFGAAAPQTAKGHWADPDSSLREDPAALVRRGHRSNGNPASLVRIASTRAVGGRPVVTARTVPAAQAAAAVAQAQRAPGAVAVTVDQTARATVYNDTYRSTQWALDALQGERLRATDPARGVTVAVVDTGVAAGHPDLSGRVVAGTDLVAGSGAGTADQNGHGTHVAGIIAATAGNSAGIAGLAPDATILPVRVLDADGSGYNSAIAQGITYAADRGAKIVNLSLGSTYDDPNVRTAVSYAQGKGSTVVAAAGNAKESGNPVMYPAADGGVVGVGATDQTDTIGTFSNTGTYVDVSAPGVDISSTWVDAGGPGYVKLSGTSMASPYVAGAIASLRAAFPTATSQQVVSALQSTAKDLGPAGRDDTFGYGRIQPLAASDALRPATSVTWTTSMARQAYGSTSTARPQLKVGGNPVVGATVQFCARKVSVATYACATKVTDSTGAVSWSGTLAESTIFTVNFAGTSRLKPVYSRAGIQIAHRVGATGGYRALSLSVAPRAATVYVDRWNGTSWVLTRSATTSSTGTASVTALAAGKYRVRTTDVRAANGMTTIYGASATATVS